MTVQELITTLKHYPAKMQVMVPGYEGRFDQITMATETEVFFSPSEYFGNYKKVDHDSENPITALVLSK